METLPPLALAIAYFAVNEVVGVLPMMDRWPKAADQRRTADVVSGIHELKFGVIPNRGGQVFDKFAKLGNDESASAVHQLGIQGIIQEFSNGLVVARFTVTRNVSGMQGKISFDQIGV